MTLVINSPGAELRVYVVNKALRNAWLLQCFVLSTSHFKGSQKALIFSRNVYETTAPRLFRLQFLSWQGSVHLSTVILAGYSDWTLQSQFYFFLMSNSLPQVSDPQTDTPRLPGCFSKWLRVCLHWQSMSSIIPGPTSCRSQLFSINCPFCLGKACKLLQFLVLSLSSPTQSLWGKVNGGWRFWTESQSLRVRSANDCAPIGKHKKSQKKAEPQSLTPGDSRDVDVPPNNPNLSRLTPLHWLTLRTERRPFACACWAATMLWAKTWATRQWLGGCGRMGWEKLMSHFWIQFPCAEVWLFRRTKPWL